MIEEKEGNLMCCKCGRLSIASWHPSAGVCDDCLDCSYWPNRFTVGAYHLDRWISENRIDDFEKALEDSRC